MDKEQDVKRLEDGFSLVEILLAVAILAIVCLGIMALLPNGYKQITTAGRKATMDHIAQMKLDYLRSIPVSYIDLTVGRRPTTGVLWPMPNGSADKYSVYWQVSNGSVTNSRNIRLYVGYDTHNADGTDKSSTKAVDQQSMVYTTMVAQ